MFWPLLDGRRCASTERAWHLTSNHLIGTLCAKHVAALSPQMPLIVLVLQRHSFIEAKANPALILLVVVERRIDNAIVLLVETSVSLDESWSPRTQSSRCLKQGLTRRICFCALRRRAIRIWV